MRRSTVVRLLLQLVFRGFTYGWTSTCLYKNQKGFLFTHCDVKIYETKLKITETSICLLKKIKDFLTSLFSILLKMLYIKFHSK